MRGALAPHVRGWSNYYSRVVSARVFRTLDHALYAQLRSWAMSRHPNKSKHWIMGTYWRVDEGQGGRCQPLAGRALTLHSHTPIRRHGKVQATRSPYEGDGVYGSTRVGRHPTLSLRVARPLRTQQGRCRAGGVSFTEQDILAVDHIMPQAQGGNESDANVPLLHRHCHARKTAHDQRACGTFDTRHGAEEPDDAKASRPVLNPSRGGDTPA